MNSTARQFEISSVSFEKNDQDVLLQGTILQGHMSYNTNVLVTQTGLNKLINELYRQNEGFDVHEMLRVEQIGSNETMFSADFIPLPNRIISLENILGNQSVKQIRA